jgi:hypothetical protein
VAVVVATAVAAAVASATDPFWISGRDPVKTGSRLLVFHFVPTAPASPARARYGASRLHSPAKFVRCARAVTAGSSNLLHEAGFQPPLVTGPVPDMNTSLRHTHPWFGPLNAAGWHALAAGGRSSGLSKRFRRRDDDLALNQPGRTLVAIALHPSVPRWGIGLKR